MRTGQKIIKPLCSLCFTEMRFVEGDMIFGDKWFHKECAPKYRVYALSNKQTCSKSWKHTFDV